MNNKINCFIPFREKAQAREIAHSLKQSSLTAKIYWLTTEKHSENPEIGEWLRIDSLCSTDFVRKIAARADTAFTLLCIKPTVFRLGLFALERMIRIAEDSGAGLTYADHYQLINGKRRNYPVIDYQTGSLRDDFDFGSLLLYSSDALKMAVSRMNKEYTFAGLYDLRLKIAQTESVVHINEFLYTESEEDIRKSGEKLFDYVNPKNREVQIEMEQACTEHLRSINSYLPPLFKKLNLNEIAFEFEASVIIPVRNRVRTIADAIRSVLSQKTNFKFNLIVIDNHSTDGTTELIDRFSDDRLIHLIPENQELGIGGCWNVGVSHPLCGKFAVQLDSDDVYSDENTLQKIVDAFYAQQCAMVVGTYRLTDFDLQTIPPGVIDHKEWTPENGRNNALRINGLGAPRAFYTPLLRQIKVPNTSYGEDYALGLCFSREYLIGRIYDVLYLCRRWEENSDASLDVEKMNAHNTYKDRIRTWELQARTNFVSRWLQGQLHTWKIAQENYESLKQVRIREFTFGDFVVRVQFNPSRLQSSTAKTDAQSIQERKCFLCPEHLYPEQKGLDYQGKYQLLVNPFPIFPEHFTIPTYQHTAQKIRDRFEDMLDLAKQLDRYILFYNGAKCGASAPDHFHFQAGNKGFLPIEKEISFIENSLILKQNDIQVFALSDYLRTGFFVKIQTKESAVQFFNRLCDLLAVSNDEPMLNLLAEYENSEWRTWIFLREKHRPACFSAEKEENILISPASVDMGGVLITPLEKDFDKITAADIQQILREVCLSDSRMQEIINQVKKWE